MSASTLTGSCRQLRRQGHKAPDRIHPLHLGCKPPERVFSAVSHGRRCCVQAATAVRPASPSRSAQAALCPPSRPLCTALEHCWPSAGRCRTAPAACAPRGRPGARGHAGGMPSPASQPGLPLPAARCPLPAGPLPGAACRRRRPQHHQFYPASLGACDQMGQPAQVRILSLSCITRQRGRAVKAFD